MKSSMYVPSTPRTNYLSSLELILSLSSSLATIDKMSLLSLRICVRDEVKHSKYYTNVDFPDKNLNKKTPFRYSKYWLFGKQLPVRHAHISVESRVGPQRNRHSQPQDNRRFRPEIAGHTHARSGYSCQTCLAATGAEQHARPFTEVGIKLPRWDVRLLEVSTHRRQKDQADEVNSPSCLSPFFGLGLPLSLRIRTGSAQHVVTPSAN